jgi:HSP20 family molecular chaperone IbpA
MFQRLRLLWVYFWDFINTGQSSSQNLLLKAPKRESSMSIQYTFDKDPTPIFIGYADVDHDLQAVNQELYQQEFDPGHWPFFKITRNPRAIRIDLHVASYKQNELDVAVDSEGVLTITGTRVMVDTDMSVVFDGIVQPDSFKRQFRLADNIVIDSVGYADGCLTIMTKVMFLDRAGDYGANFKPGDTPVQPEPPAPPVVEPEPVVEPVPEPTPEPVVEPTPEPVVEPAPEPAPAPEPVVEPAPTPEPTPEPAPVVEPVVEPAPVVEPTPEPTPEPAPAPEPVANT